MREFSMTIVTAWHGRRQQAGNMGFGGRPCKYAWNCMISSRKRKNLPPMGGPSYSLPILLWFSSLGFCPLPSFQTQLTALQLVTAKKTWTIIACALLLHPPPLRPGEFSMTIMTGTKISLEFELKHFFVLTVLPLPTPPREFSITDNGKNFGLWFGRG